MTLQVTLVLQKCQYTHVYCLCASFLMKTAKLCREPLQKGVRALNPGNVF